MCIFYRFKNQRDLQKHTEVHNEGTVYRCTVEGCDYSCHTFQTMSHHFKRVHEVGFSASTKLPSVAQRLVHAAVCLWRQRMIFINRLGGCPSINAIFAIRCSPGVTLWRFTFARSMSWSGPLDIHVLGKFIAAQSIYTTLVSHTLPLTLLVLLPQTTQVYCVYMYMMMQK